jgi:hypothetical protein
VCFLCIILLSHGLSAHNQQWRAFGCSSGCCIFPGIMNFVALEDYDTLRETLCTLVDVHHHFRGTCTVSTFRTNNSQISNPQLCLLLATFWLPV